MTLSTLAFSVGVAIVSVSFTDAIMLLWQEGAADTGLAHVQAHAKDYWLHSEGVEEGLTLQYENSLEKRLATDPNVDSFARRLKIEGIVSAKGKTIYFIGMGIDPENETKVSPRLFNPEHDSGTFVSSKDKLGVTVGKGLAESLGLGLGDDLSLLSQSIFGTINAVDAYVAGIVDVPLPSFSKRVVYLHIDHAQRLIRFPDHYNELAIRLRSTQQAETWAAELKQTFAPDIEVRGWWEVDPVIKDVESIFDVAVGVVSFLLFLSAGLSVLNLIFMVVAERTVEIGTLMALGARPRDVAVLFSLESIVVGLMGGMVGVVIGNIAILIMGVVGVPVKNPFSSGMILVHPEFNLSISLLVMACGMLICAIAAIAPSVRASGVQPVQAFRGQMT